jgi:hypothetical protein
MTSQNSINEFLAQKKLALIGISRSGKKFGNMIFKELKSKGYHVFPINPNVESIQNERCYPSLKALPEQVGGVIVVVPPVQTEKIVQDLASAEIKHIWMQQGSESKSAIQFCKENGISVVEGECILMFAKPIKIFHRMHRGIWKLLGKYPK